MTKNNKKITKLKRKNAVEMVLLCLNYNIMAEGHCKCGLLFKIGH